MPKEPDVRIIEGPAHLAGFQMPDIEGDEVTDKEAILRDAAQYDGDELNINLWYPDATETAIRKFVIGLVDVRAADDIRISYDKKRDGWKIEQASVFSWPCDDKICDPDWQEVAFVQAWGRDPLHGAVK